MVLLAPRLMGVSTLDAAVMGAVSPAVLVPRMLRLLEEGYGAEKGIPQMILAGASVDDVFVIVLFSSFTGMAQGGSPRASALLGAPVSILLTAPLGCLTLGLSGTVIDVALIYLSARLFPAFQVPSLLYACLTALLINGVCAFATGRR